MAEWFGQRGVALVGYDQQGFGQSAGQRGHAPSFDAYLDDVGTLLEKTRQMYPDVPLFLYGHSMGGNVALNFVLRRRPAHLTGLIASGPWVQLAFEPPKIKVWLGRLLRRVVPRLALPTELDVTKISRDAAVVAAYRADPLVHDKVSAAAGIALMEGAAWLDAYAGTVPCPILIGHGTADALTSQPASAALAQRLIGDVTYRAWPDFYHEIHNEPERAQVFEFTRDWMAAR
jgi:acylglycerol lipase